MLFVLCCLFLASTLVVAVDPPSTVALFLFNAFQTNSTEDAYFVSYTYATTDGNYVTVRSVDLNFANHSIFFDIATAGGPSVYQFNLHYKTESEGATPMDTLTVNIEAMLANSACAVALDRNVSAALSLGIIGKLSAYDSSPDYQYPRNTEAQLALFNPCPLLELQNPVTTNDDLYQAPLSDSRVVGKYASNAIFINLVWVEQTLIMAADYALEFGADCTFIDNSGILGPYVATLNYPGEISNCPGPIFVASRNESDPCYSVFGSLADNSENFVALRVSNVSYYSFTNNTLDLGNATMHPVQSVPSPYITISDEVAYVVYVGDNLGVHQNVNNLDLNISAMYVRSFAEDYTCVPFSSEPPTIYPTMSPTLIPTAAPTIEATSMPSAVPTYAPTDSSNINSQDDDTSPSLSSGAIAGVVIGVLIGVGLLVAAAYYWFVVRAGQRSMKTPLLNVAASDPAAKE